MLAKKTKLSVILAGALGLSGCFWDSDNDTNSAPTVTLVSEQTQTYGLREISVQVNAYDPDGDALSFNWEQLSGTPELDLSNIDEHGNLTVVLPDVASTETFKLQVNVSDGEFTVSDEIDINADKSNPIPSANIMGKATIAKVRNWPIANQPNLSILTSDGSVGLNPIWKVIESPENSQYTLTSPNSHSTGFFADTSGEYRLELVLDNEQDLSAFAHYTINVIDDIDGDGLSDSDDLDADGDGYLNDDLFPLDKASHSDSDGDGVSNYHQHDEDGDGVVDQLDGYPFDASKDSWPEHIESPVNNDGIAVSETVTAFPSFISGTLQTNSGYDQDYYRLTLPQGRVSIQLKTSLPFAGFITLVDAQGIPVAFMEHTLPGQRIISAVIPSSGNYFFALGANISETIDYQALVYLDSDQDGLSDEMEQALDSNFLSADSDADGVSDGIEFYGRATPTLDMDGDGLPSWWDLDSDNDLIADQLEMLNVALDVDNDGAINSQDEDSDNNGQLDSVEVGFNFMEPSNIDGDQLFDFVDADNDNDMVDDTLDSEPNIAMLNSVARDNKPLEITQVTDSRNQITFQCLPSQSVSISLSNFNHYSGLKTVVRSQGESSVIPHTVEQDTLQIDCQTLGMGNHLLLVTDGETRTGEYPIEVLQDNALLLSQVSLSGNQLTLHGTNLNQPFVLHYSAGTLDIDNRYSDQSYTLTLPSNFVSGEIYLDHAYGSTQSFYVSYKQTASHNVTSELPTGIQPEDVYLSTSLDNEVPFNPNGNTLDIDVAQPEIATLSKYIGEEIYTLGYAPVLPSSSSIQINATTTAVGYLWHSINNDWSNASAEQQLQAIYALDSVQQLGELIYNGLASDLDYLLSDEIYLSPLYQQALTDIKASLVAQPNALRQGRSNSPIVITPEQEIDDIGVKIDGDNQFNIENDTKLHLSFQVVSSEGKSICQYGSGMWSSNFVGPQETMWHIASTGICGGSVVQDSTVRVLSAGSDASYDAMLTPGQISAHEKSVRQYLVGRTIIDGVVLPQLMFILDNAGLLTINKNQLATIFLTEAPWFMTEVMEFTTGGQSLEEFRYDVLVKLKNDFLSYGPVTQAIFKAAAQNLTAEALAKLAAKAVKKAIPVIGQLLIVKDFTLMGVDIGKTLTDLSSVDVVIDFQVEVELEVTSVEPAVIMPDGEPKQIIIDGRGFQPVKPDFWSSKKYPMVTLTSTLSGEARQYKPYYINHDGTEMWIMAGASLFNTDDDVFDLSVKHSAFDLPAEELKEAITVEADLVLSSVSKTQAASNDILTVKGSGFSKFSSENMVMFGQYQVAILSLSSTELSFRIPKDLDPGTYAIKAKRLDINDSKWSNELEVEIAEADVVITVCDNGGLKDDNFALDVDGQRVGQTATSNSKYCFAFPITLPTGVHSATLTGLDAPDGIGTYSISFSGVTDVSGAPTSGSDLVPGSAPKQYSFKVIQPSAPSVFMVPKSIPRRLGAE
ncbi:IPT/TIG domain-containing protein [Vibrio sp. TRT 21S02]|uniref:IPT/TIG domain-containing protein n=1 Tax=Vibrio sp. TRT 21S02 TaxID=3418507 RepID=UPI003CF04B6B